MELRVQKIGNSLGVVLPDDLIDRLHVEEGDGVTVVETPDGIQLSPSSEKLLTSMKTFDRVRSRYRDTLRELAK